MAITSLKSVIGDIDIYLLDQILKGRYKKDELLLDAGCGNGRNLTWFLQNNLLVSGIDRDLVAIQDLKERMADLDTAKFNVCEIENTPFADNYFDHIICSAVLHFARGKEHFQRMCAELVRVLKPNGSIFIRMASNIGIEDKVILIDDGVYFLPDDSTRFLLTKPLLVSFMKQNQLSFLEPLKTVNVDDIRCMSTLVLQKFS
ncbi:MAG: class I SAM-dependent methyltransferase [Chitinophagaceae bacterium]